MNERVNIKEWFRITFAMLLISAGVYYFMLPAKIVVGSISGLVMVLTNFVPLSQSVLTLIINAVILVLGYIFIGKDFGIKTIVT